MSPRQKLPGFIPSFELLTTLCNFSSLSVVQQLHHADDHNAAKGQTNANSSNNVIVYQVCSTATTRSG